MAKYIDVDKLRKLLANRYEEITVPILTDKGGLESFYRRSEIHNILKIVDSLQQEQQEEPDKDLEDAVSEQICKAADKHIRKVVDAAGHPGWDWATQDIADAFIAGAKWQEKRDEETIKTAEDHAFLAGADWQKKKDDEEQAELFTIVALDAAQRAKEQMMKGAVEGIYTKSIDVTVVFAESTALDVDPKSVKVGDKVKLIVIKED